MPAFWKPARGTSPHNQQHAVPKREVIRPTAASSTTTNLAQNSASASHAPSREPLKAIPKRKVPGGNTERTASSKLSTKSTRGVKQRRPQNARIAQFDDDDDESDIDHDDTLDFTVNGGRKRARTVESTPEVQNIRYIVAADAFSAPGGLGFINASDICLNRSNKFIQAFNETASAEPLYLQYPGASTSESYQLVSPREDNEFGPLHEIKNVIRLVAKYYIPIGEQNKFNNEENGIIRNIERAIAPKRKIEKPVAPARNFELEFRGAVDEYNSLIRSLKKAGLTKSTLEKLSSVPLELVECILTQTYARTVSLKVDSLKKYENGTDNVYGELMPKFISKIFRQTKLRSDQIFLDLGSGVGNVVLQAALEVGCESWGCEMMENACALASAQKAEFNARCLLWGLKPGAIRLEKGDFLENRAISALLGKADVVLVNNQAFTPQLNADLVLRLLDLKHGCQVVSLKSFVPKGYKISSRNVQSPINFLRPRIYEYFSDSVSWTNAGGEYCIAFVDREMEIS